MAEPKFIPKPGQVDYTTVRYAPVINTVITHKGKILLVQRSADMRLYPNYWSGVSGFLDDQKSIEEKVYEELKEELGIKKTDVESLTRGAVLLQESPEYQKTWLVVPVLVKVKTSEFEINWESSRAQWFARQEIVGLKLTPGFDEVLGPLLQ